MSTTHGTNARSHEYGAQCRGTRDAQSKQREEHNQTHYPQTQEADQTNKGSYIASAIVVDGVSEQDSVFMKENDAMAPPPFDPENRA